MYRLAGRHYDISDTDANCRYWRVEITEQDRDKTAFTFHHRLARLHKCHLDSGTAEGHSTCNGRPKSEGKMAISPDLFGGHRKVSETPDKHIKQVRQVLTLMTNAGLKLNLKKCKFLTNCIDYFGNVIHSGRLSVSTRTIDVLQGPEHPTDLAKP